jgi:outer membrane protein OmpA-like peptidoglycan-associated protein
MKKILILCICFWASALFAQTNPMFYNFRSVAQSSFLNPAHVSRQAFTIGLFDNFNHISTPGISAYDILRNDETAEQSIEKILNNSSYHLKDIHLYNEINPFFLGFRIKKNYFSFAIQNSVSTNIGLPKDLLSLLYYGNANSTQTFNKDIVLSDLQLKSRTYTSLSASFTREFGEKLTIGIRGKYHVGLTDLSLERNNTTIKTDSGSENSYKITASTDYLLRGAGITRIEDLQSQLANSTTGSASTNLLTDFGQNLFKNPIGSGFSIDLGADYKFNKKLSVSASILDLGSITWKEARSYSQKGTFIFEGFNTDDPSTIDSAEFAQLQDSLNRVFEPKQDTINAYTTRLNPRFYIGMNYQLFKSGSIGLVGYGETWNGKFYPGASISYTQRLWRLMDLRVNYNIYRGNNQNVGAGIAVNLAPISIYMLSDNIMGWAPTDGTLRLDGRYTTVRFGVNINIGGRFDKDNDGIPNAKDKCKKVYGPVKFDGCPDTDGDGVPDKVDNCPNITGPIENMGCPNADSNAVKLNDTEKNIVSLAAKNTAFIQATSKISDSSMIALNNLANLLLQKTDYKIEIIGHSDNKGKEKNIQQSSEDRANAVKSFLLSKGIKEARIKTKGLGSALPIADNKTAEGRQKNRRVDYKIIK